MNTRDTKWDETNADVEEGKWQFHLSKQLIYGDAFLMCSLLPCIHLNTQLYSYLIQRKGPP